MALAFTGPGSTDAINLGDLKHCRWLAKDVFTIFGIFKGVSTFADNHNPLVAKQAAGLSQFFVRVDDGLGTENFEIGNTTGLIDLGADSDVTLNTWYCFLVRSIKGSVSSWLFNLQTASFVVDGRTSTHGSNSADLTASIRIASRHDATEFFEGEMCHVASVEYAAGRHDVIAYARDPAAWLAQLPKWLIHFYLPMDDEDVRDHGPHQIKPTVIGTVVRAANPTWGWLNGSVPLAEYWRIRERAQFRLGRAPTGASVQQTQVCPFESLQGILQTQVAPTESLQGVQQEQIVPTESLQGIQQTQLAPTESLRGISQEQSAPFESLQGVEKSQVMPFESRGATAIENSQPCPFESLQGIFQEQIAPFESSGLVSGNQVVPLESVQLIAQSQLAPFESLLGILATQVAPTESLLGVQQSQVVPFESLLNPNVGILVIEIPITLNFEDEIAIGLEFADELSLALNFEDEVKFDLEF